MHVPNLERTESSRESKGRRDSVTSAPDKTKQPNGNGNSTDNDKCSSSKSIPGQATPPVNEAEGRGRRRLGLVGLVGVGALALVAFRGLKKRREARHKQQVGMLRRQLSR